MINLPLIDAIGWHNRRDSVYKWTPQERRALLNCRLHLGIVNHRHDGRHRERPINPPSSCRSAFSAPLLPNEVERQRVIDLLEGHRKGRAWPIPRAEDQARTRSARRHHVLAAVAFTRVAGCALGNAFDQVQHSQSCRLVIDLVEGEQQTERLRLGQNTSNGLLGRMMGRRCAVE